ncbi:sigma-54 interaction domain-containing protein [Crassaminicella indica]|uniref:Sigma 54-interacting transcriptional regulator n=1 Tax=Crassaminicella indica TaxID=2855394 RepID=A0ABX8RCJ6_9CLOT|nr:sigma 54-interacting transcriptional regulator [Crassaminicella indica]QXM06777.1 sigma 54-interacting transcriptional regulator [Crassaminicella indica]
MEMIFTQKNVEKILDHVEEGIQIIDGRGRIVYFNKAAAEHEEIKREEAVGKHILDIYPSLDPETSTLLRAIEKGVPTFDIQQTFLNYKGKKITTINSSFPIKAKGKIIGAIEISRNITDVKELSEKVVALQEQLIDKKKGKKSNKNGDSAQFTFFDIIGRSKEMVKVKGLAMKAAQTASPVLIYGETGTGKELFVHAIHTASCRRDKPFIAQNCGALPAALLESILFGTVKGSFTGADNRAGLFELANGGTLFLDEINSMPIELQVKLLRVLQDGRIRRVGDSKTRQVDVRIIAASNEDPLSAVENKRLRRDLYYRLNVISLKLPELKDRKGDIPILTKHFVDKFNNKLNKEVLKVSDEVLEVFENYDWPGNVRELEHVIEGTMNLMDGNIITIDCLPMYFEKITKRSLKKEIDIKNVPLNEALKSLEIEMIKNALREGDGNISHAADSLKIPRQTLQYKIKKYKLQ